MFRGAFSPGGACGAFGVGWARDGDSGLRGFGGHARGERFSRGWATGARTHAAGVAACWGVGRGVGSGGGGAGFEGEEEFGGEGHGGLVVVELVGEAAQRRRGAAALPVPEARQAVQGVGDAGIGGGRDGRVGGGVRA